MLNAWNAAVERQVGAYSSWHIPLAAGRTIIALAQISILLFTPASALFVPVAGAEAMASCDRTLVFLSPYCWFDGAEQIVSIAIVVALVWVASGFLPQASGFVHAWLSFSFAQAISLPDGGDYVAQVVTIFLAFVSLGHNRLWYWQKPKEETSASVRAAVGVGAMWAVRLQIAWIYLNSGLSKISVGEWQEGSAIYYVTRMEWFGSAGIFGELVMWATSLPGVALAVTWGTIIGECAIAVLILLPRRLPAAAWAVSAALHLGIVVVIGLFSFGFIMIGAVLAAAAPGVALVLEDLRVWKVRRREPEPESEPEPEPESLAELEKASSV